MTSTAIPARLEFQCGHAALVSLPRIKGETSAQRNARIAQEKSAAQARSCDFCAPRLELRVQAVAPPPLAVAPAAPQATPPDSTTRVRQRRSATPRPRPASPPLQRFTVHYRVDGVLTATDIRDALRQAETLGATELFGITRAE